MKIRIFILIILVFFAEHSFGCICTKPTVWESVHNPNSVIFKGKLVKENIKSNNDINLGHSKYKFQIYES